MGNVCSTLLSSPELDRTPSDSLLLAAPEPKSTATKYFNKIFLRYNIYIRATLVHKRNRIHTQVVRILASTSLSHTQLTYISTS